MIRDSILRGTHEGSSLRFREARACDVQNYLKTPEDRDACLDAILEDGDSARVAAGLDEIARAIGLSENALSGDSQR